jgi:sortase A
MKSTIRLLAHIFQVAGAVILVYSAFVVVRGQAFQAYEKWAFERILRNSQPAVQPQDKAQSLFHRAGDGPAPKLSSLIGRIEIPRLHLSTMILEGDEELELRLGAGHVPGTALPGEEGNVVIAAHRDTFFRPLRGILRNDQIVLTTLGGSSRYIVDSVEITGADNVAVLRASGAPALTLVTCYPFSFVGPAPSRFIVHARKIG